MRSVEQANGRQVRITRLGQREPTVFGATGHSSTRQQDTNSRKRAKEKFKLGLTQLLMGLQRKKGIRRWQSEQLTIQPRVNEIQSELLAQRRLRLTNKYMVHEPCDSAL